MELRAPGGVQLLVERLSDQRVREAVPPHRVCHDGDDPGGHGLLQHLLQLLARGGVWRLQLEERLQSGGAPLPPEDGRQSEALLTGGGEPLQASPDCRPHPVRNGERRAGPTSGRREATLGDQHSHDFGQEEGIAFRLSRDGGDQPRRRRLAGGALDEAGHLVPAQALERQGLTVRLAHHFSADLYQWMVPVQPDVAVGADEEQPGIRACSGHEPEQEQRRDVEPVEILENEDQWLAARAGVETAGEAVEQAEPRLLPRKRDGMGYLGQPLA